MEIKPEDLVTLTCNVGTLAALFDLDPRRIQQLEKDGIVKKNQKNEYRFYESQINYLTYLRNTKQPTESFEENGEQLSETLEKAKYYREKTIEQEMKNKIRAGELFEYQAVKDFAIMMQSKENQLLESLPGRLSNEVAGLTDAALIRDLLQNEVRKVRDLNADYFNKLATQTSQS
jgi:phage terminase Nu1 subunit (DNA packaging protein)